MTETPEYRHATITVDGRCLDLLMTENEITTCFERSLLERNKKYIDMDKCCTCWPINEPPCCPFWKKILGMCRECEE